MQGNLASSYHALGRTAEALRYRRDVYAGYLKLHGEEHERTFAVANNYALSLNGLQRFKETKALLRKTIPVARRVLGEGCDATLKMRWSCARALALDAGATLDDLREAVTTLEDMERIARRVFGMANPFTAEIAVELRQARACLLYTSPSPRDQRGSRMPSSA